MRVGQAWSHSQVYLQNLERSPVCVCESRIWDWIPCAEPRGGEPWPAPSAPRAGGRCTGSGLFGCPLHFLLRDWPLESDQNLNGKIYSCFRKAQEKYLFPSSKWKFKSMTMETISGHSQTRKRREWVDSNRAEEFGH